MRSFVAVWPPPPVVEVLRSLERPSWGGRWTTEDQWHVTLRFLGTVPGGVAVPLPSGPACEATLGPATEVLGSGVLVVPVQGLAPLAAAVEAATSAVVPPADRRRFVGHLTLARARRRADVPPSLVGVPVGPVSWAVDRVSLVRSVPGPGGSRYAEVASSPLA